MLKLVVISSILGAALPPTTNMKLYLPTVSSTIGPTWATMLNTAMSTVDAHDHTTNKGKQVPTAGININDTLQCNSNDLTEINSLLFDNLLVVESSQRSLYVVDGDLYYNSGDSDAVKITNGPALSSLGLGGFGGNYQSEGAEANYVDASSTYEFYTPSLELAIVKAGDVTLQSETPNIFIRDSAASADDYNIGVSGSNMCISADTDDNLSLDVTNIMCVNAATKETTLTGDLVVSGTAPGSKFSDTTASADDYRIYTDANQLCISADTDDNGSYDVVDLLCVNAGTTTVTASGTLSATTVSGTSVTASGTAQGAILKSSSTTPQVQLIDTTSAEMDVRIISDNGLVQIEGDADSNGVYDTGMMTLSSTLGLSTNHLRLTATEPTIALWDSTASADDFQIKAGSNKLCINADTDDNLTWDVSNALCLTGSTGLLETKAITATGTVAVTGGITATTTVAPAQGVKFPATQYASSDVNTLDDYEEGTWTPTTSGITFNGTNTSTYNYTKIGRVVFINIGLSAVTSVAVASNATISAPPFALAGGAGEAAGRAVSITSGALYSFVAYGDGTITFKEVPGSTHNGITLSYHYLTSH